MTTTSSDSVPSSQVSGPAPSSPGRSVLPVGDEPGLRDWAAELVERARSEGPAGVHQPDPGRELGGYIDDVLARSDKLLGQERTHAGGALDRPPAGLEPSGPLQKPCALMTVGGNA